MAQALRRFDRGTVYFITSHTHPQSRSLLAAGEKTNELIGGILARAVRQCGVELFAHVFCADEFHLLVRAPSSLAMSTFMQQLRSGIAIKVGRLVGWRDRFWGGRYQAEAVAGDAELLERIRFIFGRAVRSRLVSNGRKWHGLSCVPVLREGETSSSQLWRNWTWRWRLSVDDDVDIDRFAEDCPGEAESLELSVLPCWAGLTAEARRQRVARLIAELEGSAPQPRGVGPLPTALLLSG